MFPSAVHIRQYLIYVDVISFCHRKWPYLPHMTHANNFFLSCCVFQFHSAWATVFSHIFSLRLLCICYSLPKAGYNSFLFSFSLPRTFAPLFLNRLHRLQKPIKVFPLPVQYEIPHASEQQQQNWFDLNASCKMRVSVVWICFCSPSPSFVLFMFYSSNLRINSVIIFVWNISNLNFYTNLARNIWKVFICLLWRLAFIG